MPQPARSKQSPWIESLILSYGSQEGSSSSGGRLKAHVVGVGQMSQSQAQGSESPTGLLFLSDGVLQIPAILTASAWEHLQEQGDCESFTSLVNTTVCIQDYRLEFYMAHEQTKCRFFLSVGELAMTAAGPVKDNTPCSTTLPSVRLKICKTWRVLQGEEAQDSQASQYGFDLSELLGEWQHDCMQAVLEDVRERLMMVSSCPVSQQPASTTYTLLLNHSDTATATSWDVDRVRYKGEKCFSVPIKSILIREEDVQQLQTPPNVEIRLPSGLSAASEDREQDLSQVCKPSETTQPSVDDAEWRITKPEVVETDCDINKNSSLPVEDSMLHEYMITGMIESDIRPLSNPWDIFPPPCETSSSSDASPEATPAPSLHSHTASESQPDHAAILTSTQLPVSSLKESLPTSEHSKEEHSCLPLYQIPPHYSSCPTASSLSSVSPPEPFTRPSNVSPTTDEHRSNTLQYNLTALDQENQILEKNIEEQKYRKAKRKRSEPTSEALTTVEEEEEKCLISGSPPSWLFNTQASTMAKEDNCNQLAQTVGAVLKKPLTVHSDGGLFSYSYQVSGQNLQDLSQFKVPESWLHWAVKYLVAPKLADNPHSMPVTSNQMSPDI